MDSLQRLLEYLAIQLPDGATDEEITSFEAQTGLQLPDEVRVFFKTCNGVVLTEELGFLSLAEARRNVEAMRVFGIPQSWGYVPITENNNSNHYCVCCNEPLAGYIVEVFHDDVASLKFRGIQSFLTATYKFIRADTWDLDNLASEFETNVRTARDIEDGRALLHLAQNLTDVERNDAYRFGLWLLSEQQLDEIVPLLQDPDEYVREDTKRRLAAMNTPVAKQAVRESQESMKQFVAQCAAALTRAGIHVTISKDEDNLRLDPGPVWLNMEVFYSRRHDPGVFDWLVERARVLLARKNSRPDSTPDNGAASRP